MFELYRFRFHFTATDALHFPAGLSGNVLRGALGMMLRRVGREPYARIFEPVANGRGPSGLETLPRPFVFRASHLDGRTFAAGEHFWFAIHVFDMRNPGLADYREAFTQLKERAELQSVEEERMPLDLSNTEEDVKRVRVTFVTPTELKSGNQIAAQPEFPILFARIRDRLSTLRALYGPGPLEIDFRAMGKRAAQVKMTRCSVRRVEAERRSGRTGQVHSLGGFVGEAEYEGELSEFVPYLKAAQWTGVGRQTVWGKGEVRMETVVAPSGSQLLLAGDGV